MTHKRKKEAIRNYLQRCYSDQNLASLLAFARDGKLRYNSCCCFIAVPTADHALREYSQIGEVEHYLAARDLPGANSAELAYQFLGGELGRDEVRRRILIPIILAEMRRRERVRQESPSLELVG